MNVSAHVLYRFYTAGDELLYIGITTYPMVRFRDHQRNKGWWQDVSHITVANYRSRSELLAAERGAIQAERPRYNVVHNGQPADESGAEVGGRSYSLAEVVATYLPPEWADGERWLRRHLNRGDISGYRIGRVWRMTEDDVANFIAQRRNTAAAGQPPAAQPASIVDGLSERSRRRLREAS